MVTRKCTEGEVRQGKMSHIRRSGVLDSGRYIGVTSALFGQKPTRASRTSRKQIVQTALTTTRGWGMNTSTASASVAAAATAEANRDKSVLEKTRTETTACWPEPSLVTDNGFWPGGIGETGDENERDWPSRWDSAVVSSDARTVTLRYAYSERNSRSFCEHW